MGFTLLPPTQTGVLFTNQLSYERSVQNQNLLNGAGVAAGDFDGDGLCDLFFCNLEGSCALFRNKGDGRFEDVTATAGVGCAGQASRAAVFADINGDGRLDLLVSSLGGPNACFLNMGQGHFSNITQAAGLILKAGCHSMALADIDGNGTLDLYLANYGENSIVRGGGTISVRTVNGKPQVTGRHARRLKIIEGLLVELGEPDVLYLNDGKGSFTPVSWTDGTFLNSEGKPLKEAPWDMGLSVMFRDINGDGAPDIYVCNDFQTPDRIWINDGHGRFRALPELAIRSTSHNSMGVDFADIDRDGFDDFFVSDMLSRHHGLKMTQAGDTNPSPAQVGEPTDRHQNRHNTLLLNRGDQTYAEIANYAGVDASDWSWSVVFLDVDLDGYEDLLIANGHAYDTQDLDIQEKSPTEGTKQATMRGGKNLRDYPPLAIPNVLFRNRGDRTFEEVGKAWGFDSTQISHGIALADLDNDGDLDVIVSCLGAPPLIYRNESTAPRVAVRLKGKPPNTQGIGAKIKVLGGAVPMQSQEVICGGRYLSGADPMRVFAAGTLTNQMTIEVTWRDGTVSMVQDARPNHIYEIDQTGAGRRVTEAPSAKSTPRESVQPIFEDVSARLNHNHQDEPFNDFKLQPLVAKRLSQLGPGVGWYDLDGDGHDELIIGAGKGGKLAVFRSDGKGGLAPWEAEAWGGAATKDLTTVLGWTSTGEARSFLTGVASYEETGPGGVMQFNIAAGVPQCRPLLPIGTAGLTSIGALAVADIDGDGSLDLFVGGRVVPTRYPEPASSRIYLNEKGTLKFDQANSHLLENVGMVSSAVFSDLNGDGFPELILACEWGPIKIFRNDHGRFTPWDAPVTFGTHSSVLSEFTGCWIGITTGDIDGDGQLDLIVSNWGLNSSYHQPSPAQPARIYFGDFDGNGTPDMVEAYTDPESGRVVPRRDLLFMAKGLPLLRARFPTHAAYSKADLAALLGEQSSSARQVQATTLASMLFLNRSNHFEARLLPEPAQYAPAFAVNVGDMDGDGNEDIFLSQNFFAMRLEEPRLDAGRGLWLRGDGKGGLRAVPGEESGIKVYGEQRGAALCDFDEDGRIDLVVTQNRGATRLFHNQGAKPGLRIRLSGPPGNPQGIGATLRLGAGQHFGPAREIHGGSGYWSQDSAVQVMSLSERPDALWVRWPGGAVTSAAVPAEAREVRMDYRGELKVISIQ